MERLLNLICSEFLGESRASARQTLPLDPLLRQLTVDSRVGKLYSFNNLSICLFNFKPSGMQTTFVA